MKTTFTAVCAVFMVLLTGGCKTSPKAGGDIASMAFEGNDYRTISVKGVPSGTMGEIEKIFDSVSFVKLSNEREAVLGKIDQIAITDSLIIIKDMWSSRSVKVFSREGKYLRQIGNYGRGPGEYLELTHMQVNDKNIIIWDQFNQALLFYDFNGKFQRSLSFPFFAMRFHYESDDRIIFNTVNSDNDKLKEIVDYTVFECDKDANIKMRGFYRKKDTYESVLYNHNFFAKNETVFYHPSYCDTLYSMDKQGSVKTEYAFDFGRKTVPERLRQGNRRKEVRKEQAGSRYLFMQGDVHLTNNNVYFYHTEAHRGFHNIYFKDSGQLVTFSRQTLPFCPILFWEIIGSTEDAFIGHFFPALIDKDLTEWKKIPYDTLLNMHGRKRTELIFSMKPDDNPIITFFYPKKTL